jgi:hypothetical protein
MRRFTSLAALALVALASSVQAQRAGRTSGGYGENPSAELGVDAGVAFGLGSPSSTVLSIPLRSIRAGFYLSPIVSLEPYLGLTSFSGGGISGSQYDLGLGLLYHLSPSRAARQFYLRPFLGVGGTSGSLGRGSDATFGVGFGGKFPLTDRLAARLEGNFARTGNGNGGSSNQIGLLAGLSAYTR